MKSFLFYVDGIDAPKEFVKTVQGRTRKEAYRKAVEKWGFYSVHYMPIPRRKIG